MTDNEPRILDPGGPPVTPKEAAARHRAHIAKALQFDLGDTDDETDGRCPTCTLVGCDGTCTGREALTLPLED